MYLSLLVLIPLSALFFKTASMGWAHFWNAISSPRAVASYWLTLRTSFIASGINVFFGVLVAWVLVCYKFPGRGLVDAIVDLPFALSTAVGGIALTQAYSINGIIGSRLETLSHAIQHYAHIHHIRSLGDFEIKAAYSPLGIVIALTFIGAHGFGARDSGHQKTGGNANATTIGGGFARRRNTMKIQIQNLSKSYGAFQALRDVTAEINNGELVALLGPSGSGKTTLLRLIAGLENADSGSILYENNDVTKRSARERNVGFVFQHYALFSHMNIYENIAFGLRIRKWKRDAIHNRVLELLQLIQLKGLEKRHPSQLSGGQRQRVALARALAPQPSLLLLDEPFGALDAKVRQKLRRWLRRLHDTNGLTSVFVTHDQEEAFEVADRVVVMDKGRVQQIGSPDEIFAHPANDFVLDFLGGVNVWQRARRKRARQPGQLRDSVSAIRSVVTRARDSVCAQPRTRCR